MDEKQTEESAERRKHEDRREGSKYKDYKGVERRERNRRCDEACWAR